MAADTPSDKVIAMINDSLGTIRTKYPDLKSDVASLEARLVTAEQATLQNFISQTSKEIMTSRQQNGEEPLGADALTRAAMQKIKAKQQAQNQGQRVMGGAEASVGSQLSDEQVYKMLNLLLEKYAEVKAKDQGKKTDFDFEGSVLNKVDLQKGNKDDRLAAALGTVVQAAHRALSGQAGYKQFMASDVNAQVIHGIVSNLRAKTPITELLTNTTAPESPSASRTSAGPATPPPIPTASTQPPPLTEKKGPPPIPTASTQPPPLPEKKGPPPIPTASTQPPPLPEKKGPPPIPTASTVAPPPLPERKGPPPLPQASPNQPPPLPPKKPDYAKGQQLFGHGDKGAAEGPKADLPPVPPRPNKK